MAEVRNHRRYCLLKSRQLDLEDLGELAAAYRAKQDGESGTPLPATVPHQDLLAAARYTAVEDLDGADTAELTANGLTAQQANAVLAALAS